MARGLTTAQVMEQLNVRDPDTVYALGKAGKIRGGRLGRHWRWDEDSVNEFLRGQGPASATLATVARRRPSSSVASLPPVRQHLQRRRPGGTERTP